MTAASPYGCLTTGDPLTDEALRNVVERERSQLEAEREQEAAKLRPALIETARTAVQAVERTTGELPGAQEALTKATDAVGTAAQALRSVRSDDDRARLKAKRALQAAVRGGVAEEDLPAIPAQVSKRGDAPVLPFAGEGAWPRGWRA